MKYSSNAVEASGVVSSHAAVMFDVAKRNNAIILVRPVNPDSTSLIEEGFATKDLHVKGKSSNWGPQSGFICCDQAFSKLATKPDADIAGFNKKVKESIAGNYAKAVPLIISRERIFELEKQRKVKTIRQENGTLFVFSPIKPNVHFLLYPNQQMAAGDHVLAFKKYRTESVKMIRKVPKLNQGFWVFTEKDFGHGQKDWQVMLVLADQQTGLPLTADYDLFSVTPHLSNFSAIANTSGSRFKGAAAAVSKAVGGKERQFVLPNFGRVTAFTLAVRNEINSGVASLGAQKVVHHGCEVDNPVTELDYPITAFTPWKEVVGAENQTQLELMVRDLQKLGYVFYGNRLWSQKGAVTSTTKVKQDYQWDDRIAEADLNTFEVFKF
ncbi:MAG: anthrax toxin-like adenylyl cyclase domain-containing protein [Parashewanella sp.]